jgi:hypothetical protein
MNHLSYLDSIFFLIYFQVDLLNYYYTELIYFFISLCIESIKYKYQGQEHPLIINST